MTNQILYSWEIIEEIKGKKYSIYIDSEDKEITEDLFHTILKEASPNWIILSITRTD